MKRSATGGKRQRFFGNVGGVMWIDEQDEQVVRIESSLSDNFKHGGVLVNLKRGSTFTLVQERVNDEIWLPSLMEINASARVLLFKGVNVNQIVRSYNYRKFNTENKDARVDEACGRQQRRFYDKKRRARCSPFLQSEPNRIYF